MPDDHSIRAQSLLGWGVLWWFGTGTFEALDRAPRSNVLHLLLLFYSANFAAMAVVAQRYHWAALSRTTQAILPTLMVMAFAYLAQHDHLFIGMWSPVWAAAIAAYAWTLYVRKSERGRDEVIMHGAGAVFLAMILAYESYWQVDQAVASDVWSGSAGLLVLSAAAFAYTSAKARSMWPFSDNLVAYHQAATGLVAANLVLLIIASIESPGNPSPLPYIPILNPLDIVSIAGLAVAWIVLQATPTDSAWRGAIESRMPLKVTGPCCSSVRLCGIPVKSRTIFGLTS